MLRGNPLLWTAVCLVLIGLFTTTVTPFSVQSQVNRMNTNTIWIHVNRVPRGETLGFSRLSATQNDIVTVDALIVGGGPAGLLSGIMLAQKFANVSRIFFQFLSKETFLTGFRSIFCIYSTKSSCTIDFQSHLPQQMRPYGPILPNFISLDWGVVE
jgi:hypothetical protein